MSGAGSYTIVPPSAPFVDPRGFVTREWWRFLQSLFVAVNSSSLTPAQISAILEGIEQALVLQIQPTGPDYSSQISSISVAIATLPSLKASLAGLQSKLYDLELLLAASPHPVAPVIPAAILMENAGPAEKISAMTLIPNPPTYPGAMVPMVIPGVATNYQSPVATMLTGANGTNSVQGETIQIFSGEGFGAGAGNIGEFAGADGSGGQGGNIDHYGGVGSGAGGGHVQGIAGDDSTGGSGGGFFGYGGSCVGGGGGGGDASLGGGNDAGSARGGNVDFNPGASVSGPVGVVQVNSDPSLMPHPLSWVPGQSLNGRTIYTATRKELVTAIMCRIDTANGTAAAASIYKAASGTAFSGGTDLASNSFDLTGTATHTQTLSLGSQSALLLSAGDSVGVVQTGTMIASAGCITVHSTPQ